MITLHKTEIARQNNILSIFFETPQNFANHVFRGAHVLLMGAEIPGPKHNLVSFLFLYSSSYWCLILPLRFGLIMCSVCSHIHLVWLHSVIVHKLKLTYFKKSFPHKNTFS